MKILINKFIRIIFTLNLEIKFVFKLLIKNVKQCIIHHHPTTLYLISFHLNPIRLIYFFLLPNFNSDVEVKKGKTTTLTV